MQHAQIRLDRLLPHPLLGLEREARQGVKPGDVLVEWARLIPVLGAQLIERHNARKHRWILVEGAVGDRRQVAVRDPEIQCEKAKQTHDHHALAEHGPPIQRNQEQRRGHQYQDTRQAPCPERVSELEIVEEWSPSEVRFPVRSERLLQRRPGDPGSNQCQEGRRSQHTVQPHGTAGRAQGFEAVRRQHGRGEAGQEEEPLRESKRGEARQMPVEPREERRGITEREEKAYHANDGPIERLGPTLPIRARRRDEDQSNGAHVNREEPGLDGNEHRLPSESIDRIPVARGHGQVDEADRLEVVPLGFLIGKPARSVRLGDVLGGRQHLNGREPTHEHAGQGERRDQHHESTPGRAPPAPHRRVAQGERGCESEGQRLARHEGQPVDQDEEREREQGTGLQVNDRAPANRRRPGSDLEHVQQVR